MSDDILKVDFELAPHQEEGVLSNTRYLLISGGVGSGKSYTLIFRVMRFLIEYPGIRILVTDSNWPSLRDTTYSDFLDLFPNELIEKHNRVEHKVVLVNGSSVIFRAFDNPRKLKRYTFGAIFAEELTDISEEMFKMVRTRLRQPGYPGSFTGATNPSTYQNWVYKTFIENPIPDSEVLYSNTFDNRFLDDTYLNDMQSVESYDETYYRRMIRGEWGTLEGLIYELPYAQREDNVQDDSMGFYLAGTDFGYTHPTAIIVIYVSPDHVFTIREEVYRTEMTSDDIIAELDRLYGKYRYIYNFADGARPEIIKQIQDYGLPCEAATKGPGSVFSGIMTVKSLINKGKFFVSLEAANTLYELDSYVWDKPSSESKIEQPKDENNHACDAIRMAIHNYLTYVARDTTIEDILKMQKVLK